MMRVPVGIINMLCNGIGVFTYGDHRAERKGMTVLKQERPEENLQRLRLRIILKNAAGILLAGTLYVAVFRLLGFGIPCVFRRFTGLLCPGCGMSHALAAVSSGHFRQAMEYNALSLTLLPAFILFVIYRALRYVKTGSEEFRVPELLFLFLCIGICVFYFVTRNHLI